MAYGLPATVAVAAAPALVSVTLVTVLPLTSWPAPVVNSVPANVTAVPYVLVRLSAVTVSALVASGQVAHMSYHLNRAMDNGLTQAEASEVFTQLAFYTGWPSVFSALPVAKEVFEKRR